MIGLLNNDTPHVPDFQELVDQAILEGVMGGFMGFLTHNRVKLVATHKCEKPLEAFIARLLSEYTPTQEGFPFKDSLKQALLEGVANEAYNIKALFNAKEYENLRGYCHVVAAGVVADFLEARREETLKLIREIRGE